MGKTTLCCDLESSLLQRFDRVRYLTVRQSGLGRFEIRQTRDSQGNAGESVSRSEMKIVDGFERLPLVSRTLLLQHCRAKNLGLLVTTHRPIRLMPRIVELTSRFEQFQTVARRLMSGRESADATIGDSVGTSNKATNSTSNSASNSASINDFSYTSNGNAIGESDLELAYQQSGGNLREGLMNLYDVWESRDWQVS